MTRTFCTVIRDVEAESVLGPYGVVIGRSRHFKQLYVLHRPLRNVKREALKRFGLTAR